MPRDGDRHADRREPPARHDPRRRADHGAQDRARRAGQHLRRAARGGIPPRWTLLFFEVADDAAPALADALAAILDEPGWYVDFHTADESFVVFREAVFRYAKGDADGRADAEAHARAHGVPDAQIDWP